MADTKLYSPAEMSGSMSPLYNAFFLLEIPTNFI